MNNFVNPYDAYAHTENGKWDIQLFLAKYLKKKITAIELMQILQEMFIQFPYTKDFKISTISFGSLTSSTCIEIDKDQGVITIY